MPGSGFDAVRGHREIIAHMKNAVQTGKVSHAYLLAGEKGSGKKLLAGLFAAALLCESDRNEPCGRCLSCRKAKDGNHPDIIWVTHEKPELIKIDEIRHQVVETVDIRPYESRFKIYIIPDADKMNAQAQNAFLKTIEEPPSYAVILLLAENPDALLETVRSRSMRFDLRAVPDREVRGYLAEELGCSAGEAALYAAFGQGNIGRARAAAEDEAFREMIDTAVRLMKSIHDMQVVEIVTTVKILAEKKERIYDFIDLLTLWFRDVLLYKAARDVDGLIFKNEVSEIRREAASCSYEGLEEILTALGKAKERLYANVNFELAVELLVLTIRDNLS